MSGIALVCCSLTAGALVIVGLFTPGWLDLEIHVNGTESRLSMGIFYTKVCLESVCTTVDNAKTYETPFAHYSDSFWFPVYLVEGSLTIISVGIGTVLTVAFAVTNVRVLSAAGLVCNTVGVIGGLALCIHLIRVNVRYDAVISDDESLTESEIRKGSPYSVVIMLIGLILEFIAIKLTRGIRILPVRGEGGMVLAPPPTNSFVVVQHTSSVPYKQMV